MKKKKLLLKVMAGMNNVHFKDAVLLIEAFGFRICRQNGSHHIFEHPDIIEMVNIQDVKGKAKAYQLRQFFKIVEKYNLQLGDSE